MTVDSWRWISDQDGDWLCLRTKDARTACNELQSGKIYEAEIKERKKKRSLDANAYAWVLMDKLAAKTGEPKTEIYRHYVRNIGGNNTTVCTISQSVDELVKGWSKNGIGWVADTMPSKISGCTNVVLYYGSSTYDTAQMSRLIDMVVYDCKEQGIETLTPFELDALKERW